MNKFTNINGCVVDDAGRFRFLSSEAFQKNLIQGARCVLCCRKGIKSNQEHIIPNWLLKASDAHGEALNVVQTHRLKLSTYKIGLCTECNTSMGEMLEIPVSKAFKSGYDQVDALSRNQPDVLYAWLNWLHFKTHYRDRSLSIQRDKRKKSKKVGSLYDWSKFQACYHVARAPLFGHRIMRNALGSIKILKISDHENLYPLNYVDNPSASLVYVRLHDCAIVAILNDGKAVSRLLSDILLSLGPSVTVFQMSEILAEFHFAGWRIDGGGELDHEFDRHTGEVILEMKPKQSICFTATTKDERDRFFEENLRPQLEQSGLRKKDISGLFERVRRDNFSFLPYLCGLERQFQAQTLGVAESF